MIARVDHVSIAVRDYDRAYDFFCRVLGAVPGASSADPSMNYFWQLLSLGDLSRVELLKATGPGSFLDGFLAKKEGGVHHITLQTPDIRAAAEHLDRQGIPYFGLREYGDFWKELFIHPRDTFGVLVQIAQFIADDWLSPALRMGGGRVSSVERQGDGVRLTIAHPGGGTASAQMSHEEARRLRDELDTVLNQS